MGERLLVTRRQFLGAVTAGAAAAAAAAVGADRLLAQAPATPGATPGEPAAQGADPAANQGAANVPMDEGAYRAVRRPPKPGARPSMTADERDALEHHIHCQCGCSLDVYTCRTTDFSCGVSPAMHRDVMSLVEGGYSADEIIAAFRDSYGERVLMAPVKEGFNWAGYLAPFAALGTGGVVVAALIRRWGHRAEAAASASARSVHALPVDATPEELARIEAAVRGEDA
jgi:cytochrome c-type biogenesis protein CcmH